MDTVVDIDHLRMIAAKLGEEWKNFGRILGISDAEIFHIEKNTQEGQQEVNYGMLFRWHSGKGNNATYKVLIKALQDAGRTDLAQQLTQVSSNLKAKKNENIQETSQPTPKRSNETSSPLDGKRQKRENVTSSNAGNANLMFCYVESHEEAFIKQLKIKYQLWSQVLRPDPRKRDRKWHLKDLFIDCSIAALLDQQKDSKDDKNWTTLHYKEVRTHDVLKKAKVITIEGDPGIGKSTLLLQLAYLWMTRDKVMQDVKLFILLPLKLLRPGLSIPQAIKNTFAPRDKNISPGDINQMLKTNSVLALDGLDELTVQNPIENTDIKAILDRDLFAESQIVVSTRPQCLQDINNYSFSRVRINMWSEQERTSYIKKCFQTEMEQNFIQESLLCSDIINGFLEIPLLFALLISIISEDKKMESILKFDKVTKLFAGVMTCLKIHLKEKELPSEANVGDRGTLPAMNQIAFEGLIGKGNYSWTKDQFKHIKEYKRLVSLGILVEEGDDLEDDASIEDIELLPKTVRFFHKIFQEWFGAQYLAHLLDDPNEACSTLSMLPLELQYLFRFTCGKNRNAAKCILNHLMKINHFPDVQDLFYFCLYECDDDGHHEFVRDIVQSWCEKIKIISVFGHNTLRVKSQFFFLELVSKWGIPLEHLGFMFCKFQNAKSEYLSFKAGVHLRPVSARIISVDEWYGNNFASYLGRCENLQELRICNTSAHDPQKIQNSIVKARKNTGGRLFQVSWSTNVLRLTSDGDYYHLIEGEWEFVHQKKSNHFLEFKRPLQGVKCVGPGCKVQQITGILWKDTSYEENNYCDACKDTGKFDNYGLEPCTGGIFDTTEIKCHTCHQDIKELTRWKCITCSDAIVCTMCSSRCEHSEHDMEIYQYQNKNKLEKEDFNILCSNCKTSEVVNVGYECAKCLYYYLCARCKESGDHGNHRLSEKSLNCSICHHQIWGKKFKCDTCVKFYLCTGCKNVNSHYEHELTEVKERLLREADKILKCGICQCQLKGKRFNCEICNYVICTRCNDFHNYHTTLEVREELLSPTDKLEKNRWRCNECGHFIYGPRYKCLECFEYILCKDCEEQDLEHQMEVIHEGIICNVCKKGSSEIPFSLMTGNRYRCKTCKWYNLCQRCKDEEHHIHHKFDKWETSQFTIQECIPSPPFTNSEEDSD